MTDPIVIVRPTVQTVTVSAPGPQGPQGTTLDYSVRAYGAAGDGTTDDTSAVNAAITAAAAAGGNVAFPAGTYKVTGGSVTTSRSTVFRFYGGKLSIVTSTLNINGTVEAPPAQVFVSALATPVKFNRSAGGYLGPAGGIGSTRSLAEWFGAKGDASTDNATALQQWLQSAGNGIVLELAGGNYYSTAELVWPVGMRFNLVQGNGSRLTYNGSTDATKAVLSMNTSTIACYRCTIAGVVFDANSKAGFGLNAKSPGGSHSISSLSLDGCMFVNATDRNVRIGDFSSSSNDIDAANLRFENCLFMAGTGAINVEIDAPNAVSVAFRSCSLGYTSTGTIPTWDARIVNAATVTFDTCFFDRVASPGHCIYNGGASVTITACDSEDIRFLWQEATYDKQNLSTTIRGLRLSDAGSRATDGDYCIWCVAGTLSVEGLVQTGTKKYRIRCDSKLSIRNSWLGGTLGSSPTRAQGADLVLANPHRCDLDGWSPANARPFLLNGNPYMEMWTGAASGNLPVGYQSSGVGGASFTIQQAGSASSEYIRNNARRFVAKISVTTGAVSSAIIDGLMCRVRVDGRRGPGPYMVMVSGYAEGMTGATAPAVSINLYTWNGSAWAVATSQLRTCEIDANGRFWGVAVVDKASASIQGGYIEAYVGMGVASASGTIWLSEMAILRADGMLWLDSSAGAYPDLGRLKTLSIAPKPAQLNGSFANGSNWWTVGSGWSVSGGLATHTASGGTAVLSQDVGFSFKSRRALLAFTVSGMTAGSVTPALCGTSGNAVSNSASTAQVLFTVSGITTLPTAGATYTVGGVTYTVVWATSTTIMATGGIPTSSSGTLSKATGTGDASIAFSAINGRQIVELNGSTSTQLLTFTPTTDFNGSVSAVVLYMVDNDGGALDGSDWAKVGRPALSLQGIDVVGSSLNLNPVSISLGTAAPTTGDWKVGDLVLNSAPASGSASYWQCSASGTPGTWKAGPTLA